MEYGEVGELVNSLRKFGEHDLADWVAKSSIDGRSDWEKIRDEWDAHPDEGVF